MKDARQDLPPDVVDPQALVHLYETAADWFMRREQPEWSRVDQQALDAWLAQHEIHRKIFASMARTNASLGQIRQAAEDSWRRPELVSKPRNRTWRFLWVPGLATACIAILTVVGVFGYQHWMNTPIYEAQLATGLGESRILDLPDGSRVTLDVNSQLQVRYFPRRRETELQRGEGYFEVQPDSNRPFTVDSDRSQVRVVGTAFSVQTEAPHLIVKVSQGVVDVRLDRDAPDGKQVRLRAGTGIAVDAHGANYQSIPVLPTAVAQWRTGQIEFRKAPLSKVAQELSRYTGSPVQLVSEELAQQPISGVMSTQQPVAFLQALPDFLPLTVQQLPNGGWAISSR